MMRINTLLVIVALAAITSGCANHQAKPHILATNPNSILVLPPVNKSVEVNAANTVMTHITQPLAERGYYVFPVAVIERLMRENGMHTADQMHQIPLDKLNEHIAPDAILYATINQWGQKYQVFQSKAVVDVNLLLVDAKTGEPLWERRAYETYVPNNNAGNGLAGALLGAVIDQVVGSMVDHTDKLAKEAFDMTMEALPPGSRLIEHRNRNKK